MRLALDCVIEHGGLFLQHFCHDARLICRRKRQIRIRFAVRISIFMPDFRAMYIIVLVRDRQCM